MSKIKISNHQIEKLEKQRNELAADIEANKLIVVVQEKQLKILDNTIEGMKALNGGQEEAG
jgi:nitrate reductase NapAB chaperone NapD